jgi:heavy metal translocating P-type ATPase
MSSHQHDAEPAKSQPRPNRPSTTDVWRLGSDAVVGFVGGLPRDALLLALVALVGVLAGLILTGIGQGSLASWIWGIASMPVLIALLIQIATALPKGEVGLDVLAAVSMGAAVVLGQSLAGNVVALMYAGGQLLERYAEGHARREMTALLGRGATTAMRYAGDQLAEVPIAELAVGDRLLIRHGEVIPVDGTVGSSAASLDESALTGESLPVSHQLGERVLSGSTLVGPAFDLIATRPAAESTYAGIVRLVERAQQSRAPMARLADRYALVFLLLSLTLAGGAWLLAGDPLRALAVLVIATPCPLILAVPVALISGMSNAARSGVLFKDGRAIERLAQVKVAMLDKTGTLTDGEARIKAIDTLPGIEPELLLKLAASVDQASGHVVARALIADALRRGQELIAPQEVVEVPGSGIEGMVGETHVVVGSRSYVEERCRIVSPVEFYGNVAPGELTVSVGLDRTISGVIVLADQVRSDAVEVLAGMRALGVERIVLASGDKRDVANAIGLALGVDEVLCELSPAAKVEAVLKERGRGPVMMVGDGVNDAPALAAADIGVAMGAAGAAPSSEAAAVIVLVDRLAPIVRAIGIAKRTRRIAFESIFIGLGLSIIGMFAASAGFIAPVWGALLQEGIDVAVILNALRALR